jgi:hypothetical protein
MIHSPTDSAQQKRCDEFPLAPEGRHAQHGRDSLLCYNMLRECIQKFPE